MPRHEHADAASLPPAPPLRHDTLLLRYDIRDMRHARKDVSARCFAMMRGALQPRYGTAMLRCARAREDYISDTRVDIHAAMPLSIAAAQLRSYDVDAMRVTQRYSRSEALRHGCRACAVTMNDIDGQRCR